MATQIVLVPGFWLGAWAWEEVAGLLRDRGFDVAALTLPGLEETGDGGGAVDLPEDDDGAGTVGLEDHVRAIANALDEGAERRILVVHSGAAFPGAMVLDQYPDRVDRLVLVDTAPPTHGTAYAPDAEGDVTLADGWQELEEEGSFGELTEAHLDEFRRRAVPQPKAVVTAPVRLVNDARKAVPVTAICTVFPASEYRRYAEAGEPFVAGLLDYEVDYVDLPTGHWPMWSRPTELAELIAAAATR